MLLGESLCVMCKLRKSFMLTLQRHHHVCCVRQHVREQYEAVRPIAEALAAAYPDLIRPEHVSLQAFLSAVELHYSHALEARQPSALFLRSDVLVHCASPNCIHSRAKAPAAREPP